MLKRIGQKYKKLSIFACTKSAKENIRTKQKFKAYQINIPIPIQPQ